MKKRLAAIISVVAIVLTLTGNVGATTNSVWLTQGQPYRGRIKPARLVCNWQYADSGNILLDSLEPASKGAGRRVLALSNCSEELLYSTDDLDVRDAVLDTYPAVSTYEAHYHMAGGSGAGFGIISLSSRAAPMDDLLILDLTFNSNGAFSGSLSFE